MSDHRPVDDIFPQAGRQAALAARRCVNPPFGCAGPATEFRDEISRREYGISGMCQKCQDAFFNSNEEDD